jgi:hypothetical protein
MTISLSSTIYPRQCLSIAHQENKSYSIEIIAISQVSNEEVLNNEFLNYLLAVSIENHLINCVN